MIIVYDMLQKGVYDYINGSIDVTKAADMRPVRGIVRVKKNEGNYNIYDGRKAAIDEMYLSRVVKSDSIPHPVIFATSLGVFDGTEVAVVPVKGKIFAATVISGNVVLDLGESGKFLFEEGEYDTPILLDETPEDMVTFDMSALSNTIYPLIADAISPNENWQYYFAYDIKCEQGDISLKAIHNFSGGELIVKDVKSNKFVPVHETLWAWYVMPEEFRYSEAKKIVGRTPVSDDVIDNMVKEDNIDKVIEIARKAKEESNARGKEYLDKLEAEQKAKKNRKFYARPKKKADSLYADSGIATPVDQDKLADQRRMFLSALKNANTEE